MFSKISQYIIILKILLKEKSWKIEDPAEVDFFSTFQQKKYKLPIEMKELYIFLKIKQ